MRLFIHEGDHVGLATIGGSYEVFAGASSASTDGFVGVRGDMNGSRFSRTAHESVELLQRMTERIG